MKKTIVLIMCFVGVQSAALYAALNCVIESVRKDSVVTVIAPVKPDRRSYPLINIPGGSLTVLSSYRNGNGYTVTARLESVAPDFMHPGQRLELEENPAVPPLVQRFSKRNEETKDYRKNITSHIDKREMTLVSNGFFYFGSNDGSLDEAPRSVRNLPSFYIDMYEVSNRDYLIYVDSSGTSLPRSWSGVRPVTDQLNLPVLASYTEAERYAEWAGKRLPSEEEWEKAASGSVQTEHLVIQDGYIDILRYVKYPWGDSFSAEKVCVQQFWDTPRGKALIKDKKYGLVSVTEKLGVSACGAVNISGNCAEWTSSWYEARPGSTLQHPRFGKQVKVIKGGAWYSDYRNARISARDFGGIPNLDEDCSAGFRCVKEPADDDSVK
jgi:formylglycine-generating enzyme required for sulfatase activity